MNSNFDMNNNFEQYSYLGVPPSAGNQLPPKKRAADYRREARAAFSGNFGSALGANLILGAVLFVPFIFLYIAMFVVLVSLAGPDFSDSPAVIIALIFFFSVMTLLTVTVSPALAVGSSKFHLELVRKDAKPNIASTFGGFRRGWGKAIGVTFLIGLMMLGIGLLIWILFAVCAILFGVVAEAGTFPLQKALFVLLALLIYTAGVAVMIPLAYRYRLCYYLLADHPEAGVTEILHMSAQMMEGNKWRLFCLEISFIGWYLLAVYFSCGVGMLFLVPYFNTAIAAFYNDFSRGAGGADPTGGSDAVPQFPDIGADDYFPG